MSAGEERKRAARQRLSRRREPARNVDLASEALDRVRNSVQRRNTPDEAAANKIASDEIHQMRAVKRARRWISAH
jgi:hypothetical protein